MSESTRSAPCAVAHADGETLPLSSEAWRAYGVDAAVLDGALQTALIEAVHGLLELFEYTGTPVITVSQTVPGGVNVTGALSSALGLI